MEKILDVEWDDVVPGMWVMWSTPTFVKRGKVLQKKGISLKVKFDADFGETTIPDALQYFDMVRKQYALVVIKGPRDEPRTIDANARFVAPDEAAAALGTDTKGVRRRLRSGSLKGIKKNGTWLVEASQLKDRGDNG